MQHTSILAWALGVLCLLAVLVVVAEKQRARRRVLGHERRIWFEYSMLAARNAEEWTGRRA